MKLPRLIAGLFLGVVLAIPCARARAQSSADVTVGGDSVEVAAPDRVKQIYGQAKPYMNDSLPDLRRAVPELKGLKADGTEMNMQSILDRAGEAVETQVPKIPDLTASESIAEGGYLMALSHDSGLQNSGLMIRNSGAGTGRSMGEQMPVLITTDERQLEDRLHMLLSDGAPSKNFDYLVFYRPAPGGHATLEESRTDTKARNSKQSQEEEEQLHAIGFAHLWLMFLPERISQSDYRLLGEEKMNGYETYVLAFAQSPDRMTLPGQISANGRTYPLLYQGIAWIDETTFRIVRLRADLLAPLPDMQIKWLRSDLEFKEVRIPELNLPLWLPHQVELMWRQADELSGEMHTYTKYRLFHATATILPPS